MKRYYALLAFALLTTTAAYAQSNVATQQVSINVSEIAVIAVTTNGTQKKITAELDQDMPDGLTLNATMAAPSGASTAGKTALSSDAVDLVTNVTKVRGSGLSLAYEAVATVDADPDNVTRTVTYTITNN